jgi:hypothetical protein
MDDVEFYALGLNRKENSKQTRLQYFMSNLALMTLTTP